MRFWDSSAIVPLLVREPSTPTLATLRRKDPELAVWWTTPVECASAVARLERGEQLPAERVEVALARLRELAEGWSEILPVHDLRETARRLVRVHDLRASDALQLAAAIHAAEGRPSTLQVVILDARLARAAAREGFEVLPVA